MDGSHLSLRLKHGLHTIFLFVDPLQPVSAMSAQLIAVLHERYPEGELTTSQGPTPIPGPDAEAKVMYGKLRNPGDVTEGWLRMEIKDKETPTKGGITDGSLLAFAFVPEGTEEEDVEFVVDWPSVEDIEGDETLDA